MTLRKNPSDTSWETRNGYYILQVSYLCECSSAREGVAKLRRFNSRPTGRGGGDIRNPPPNCLK